MNTLKFVTLPSLKAKTVSDRQIILTQKFIDGMFEYQKYWSGSIVVFMEEDRTISNNLDNVIVNLDELPFQVKIVDFDRIQEYQDFRNASVVLTSEGYRHNQISQICKAYNIPCIYVTEYSLKTRLQIINATMKNPVVRLRRYLWQFSQQRKQKKAIASASGVQCNGVPTYKAYRIINPNPLLYFDSRMTENMLASEDEVKVRTTHCLTNAPLRLLFSGRLIAIKGADDLILVAQNLKKIGVEFELFICGDGDLKDFIQRQIQQKELSNCVKMLGVLEFKTELVPFVKKNVDLFLCCHRQGDPSCTYLETMSCGVPIIGYDNEAFAGVVNHSGAGWFVKMNRPDLLAEKIAELNNNRKAIVDESFKSIEFARLHTFEKTFERRMTHAKEILRDR